MSRFNPNSPATLGCEFFADLEGVDRLAGDLQVAGAILTAAATETIETVHVGLTGNAGRDSGWELEIYDPANLPTANTTTADYRPGCDRVNIDMFTDTLSQTNLYGVIDEASLDTTDYISPIFGAAAEYACGFTDVAGTLVGLNIVSVKLRARVAELVGFALVEGATFVPFLTDGTNRAFGQPQTFAGDPLLGSLAFVLESEWKANPFTGASWKPQDLDDFDCAGSSGAGWIIKPTGSSNNLAVIYQGFLRVEYLDEADVRLAVGTLTEPTGQVGWQSFNLTAPDGTANWAKASGSEYLFVFRRRVGDGFLDWRYLIDQEKPFSAPPTWQIVTPRVFPSTLTLAEQGANRDGVYAILLETNAGAISVDSQPYLSINDDGGPQARFQHQWTFVNTDGGLIQEFTTVGADDYGVVRFLVSWETSRPDAPLLVRLKLRSTSAQVGGTLTIDPLDLEEPRARWQVYEAEIPGGPVALLAATQYEAEFSSAATAGTGWRVQVLSTLLATDPGGPPAGAYGQTFGGTTDVAQVGSVERPSLDAAVTIATQPDPLDNVAAAVTDVDDCRSYATVSWAISADPDFLRYEVERMDDATNWERIGNLTDVAALAFVDVAARRGVPITYRVRQRRTDLSFSAWEEASPVTITTTCCGFVLASNEARDWSVFVVDVGDRGWEFPQANDTANFRYLAGRDYGVGFGELEQRGAHFTFQALVAADGEQDGVPPLVTPGIENFDALRWLLANSKDPSVGTKLALSCVAVLDEQGGRWLAQVQILSATRNGETGAHIATIRVRETQDKPTPVTVGGAGTGS